jgi:hypothetical protein
MQQKIQLLSLFLTGQRRITFPYDYTVFKTVASQSVTRCRGRRDRTLQLVSWSRKMAGIIDNADRRQVMGQLRLSQTSQTCHRRYRSASTQFKTPTMNSQIPECYHTSRCVYYYVEVETVAMLLCGFYALFCTVNHEDSYPEWDGAGTGLSLDLYLKEGPSYLGSYKKG